MHKPMLSPFLLQPLACSNCQLDVAQAPPAYSEVFAASPSRQAGSQNLLVSVKLNLNKIQLLSAEDLVLLSRLIDVPIVVHEPSVGSLELAQPEQSQTGS